jgi:Uma2 family endonuclease
MSAVVDAPVMTTEEMLALPGNGVERWLIDGRNPDTTVGIDVVYIAANLAMLESDETTLIDGVPTLVIEFLSPSDTIEAIEEKIDLYQKAGVPLVWIIDPHDRTITIYRLDAEPELVNIHQELSGEPFLPGFRVAVAQIFA